MEQPNTQPILQKPPVAEYLLLFATGFFAMSTYSDVVIGFLGYNLIELLFIPVLLYYWYTGKLRLSRRISISWLDLPVALVMVATICLGFINAGNVFSVVTCIRPFLYILLILKYLRSTDSRIPAKKLYPLAMGCIFGDITYMTTVSALYASKGYHHINIIALVVVTLIPILQHKKLKTIISFTVSISAAILSGYRINTVVVILSLFSAVLFITLTTKLSLAKLGYLFLVALMVAGLLWCLYHFEEVSVFLADTLNLSRATVYRSLDRIADLLTGDYTLGDENRLIKLAKPFREFRDYLFPLGPIGKTDLSRFGNYTDSPILFLYDLFGSLGAWIFIILYAINAIRKAAAILRRWNRVSELNKLYVMMLPILLCLFVLNGTFLTFVNISIFFALAISGDRLDLQHNAPGPSENRRLQ